MKKKILIGLLLLLLLGTGGYFVYKRVSIANIFDEIYHDQKAAVSTSIKPSLEKIKDISNPNKGEPVLDVVNEEYNKASLPKNITAMTYSFDFSKEGKNGEEFGFEIRYDLGDAEGKTINISYLYNVKTKTLSRKLWIFTGARHNADQEVVKNFLENHNSSIKKVQSYSDQILKDKVLKDWVSVYPSRFTPTNWGDVKVVDEWDKP